MRKASYALLLILLFVGPISNAHDDDVAPIDGFPEVLVDTTFGEFVIELETTRAPVTVRNFLELVNEGYYNNTTFHRVIPGFVVQGGGYGPKYQPKPETPEIINESGNGLSNLRGTIAMAREDAPHTANSQFYINLDDNVRLDPREDRWGYTVFGRVTSGMDVLDAVAGVPTGATAQLGTDVPAMAIVVRSMRVLSPEEIKQRLDAELEAAREMLDALESE
ncbi:MAG: peptidylprolyl isomerase [Pseudomonadota bacterium]